MHIHSLDVVNFRGIERAHLANLANMVVIAGENGSGKSCLLDAIRLIKSSYGGYHANEIHNFYGELQINFTQEADALVRLSNNPTLPTKLRMTVRLSDEERTFLSEHARRLIELQSWRTVSPEMADWRSLSVAPMTAHFRRRQKEATHITQRDIEFFDNEILQNDFIAEINMNPGQQPTFLESKVLELAFSSLDSDEIGILDYHGPQRTFSREQLNSINVNLESIKEQRRQNALYNYSSKYSNIKSELAGLYVREALAVKAGVKFATENSLTSTLQSLFKTFFRTKNS